MGLMVLGGWMMWPLLAVSVAALAIIVERALIFMSCPFPDRAFSGLVLEAARTGDAGPLAAHLGRVPLLRAFAGLLDGPARNREAALRLAGEEVLARLEARLPLLSMLARLAPLMGLLGTILGMIATFSRIAGAASGVDMTLLAGGIWQALLTTAAGLCIAIPALFFLSLFQGRVRRVAEALNRAGNAALLADAPAAGPAGSTGRAGDAVHAGAMRKEAAGGPQETAEAGNAGAKPRQAAAGPCGACGSGPAGETGAAGGRRGASDPGCAPQGREAAGRPSGTRPGYAGAERKEAVAGPLDGFGPAGTEGGKNAAGPYTVPEPAHAKAVEPLAEPRNASVPGHAGAKRRETAGRPLAASVSPCVGAAVPSPSGVEGAAAEWTSGAEAAAVPSMSGATSGAASGTAATGEASDPGGEGRGGTGDAAGGRPC